ncbi:MAG: histidine phosphatase family protein [Thermoplasmata archaeon]
MTRLYLVRHGETQWNVEGRMQGWKDSPLTEQGINQVLILRRKIRDVSFSEVYSSTSNRALKTAEILLDGRGVSITKEKDLREVYLGEWEGKRFEVLDRESPEDFKGFWEIPQGCVPRGGESMEELMERGTGVISKIIKKHPDENVLLVSHYCILKTIIIHLQDRLLKDLWELPDLEPASLTVYDTNKGCIIQDQIR